MKKILFLLVAVCAVSFPQMGMSQRYQGDLSFAYGVGVGTPGLDGWNIQTVHGYRFNDHLFVGGGIGLIKFSDVHESIIPVFANVKGYLSNDHVVNPFASLDLGYGIREQGGLYFSPAIGVQFRLFRRLGLFATFGYQYSKVYSTNLSNINIRIGISF